MSNELGSDRATVMNWRVLESMVLPVTSYDATADRAAKFDNPAVKIMFKFQITQIVRFLPERGLRFRNLGFCDHDSM